MKIMKIGSAASWTHVKEISGTKLLISLHTTLAASSANIEVFNLANKGRPETIYSFDEVVGCKFATSNHLNRFLSLLNLFNNDIKNNHFLFIIDTGFGDLTYNSKRNLLGAISVSGKIAYHLFFVDTNCLNIKKSVKLIRKSKWHLQYGTVQLKVNLISYFYKFIENDNYFVLR